MADNGARGKVHLSQEELNLDKMEVRGVAQGGMEGRTMIGRVMFGRIMIGRMEE